VSHLYENLLHSYWAKIPSLLFFLNNFLIRIYSLYRGGFVVTSLIRLILYVIYITPSSLPLSPFPNPLKAIARGFLVLFHIDIQNPSTIYCHLNLLPSPSLLSLVLPPHSSYFIDLVFIINI
jgi:hypothetical protein